MSWSAGGTFHDGDVEITSKSNVVEVKEHTEQYLAAITAVARVVASGVVGKVDGKFKFSISGHGNPNHEPTPGWADDFVTINVYQVREEANGN